METMDQTRTRPHSLLDLISGLREDVRLLFKQEVRLATTELSEKASHFKRHGVLLGVGGAIGYLAFAMFLIGLGFLLALAFERLGLSAGFAAFLGFTCVGLVFGVISAILLVKAIGAFSRTSIVPEKTIETLKEMKDEGIGQNDVYRKPEGTPASRSSKIKSDIELTRSRIGYEVSGIRNRLNMVRVTNQMASQLRSHPMRSVGIGLGTGVAGFVLVRISRLIGRRRVA
jgi:hypothetical protein